jgi:hypothetical protein
MSGQDEQRERERKRERKKHTVRPAGLKTRRSFSYTKITKKFLFLTVLLLFAQCKMHYW